MTRSANRDSAETPGRPPEATPAPGRLDGLIAMAERTLAPAPQSEGNDARGGQLHDVVVHLDQAVLGPDGTREAYLDDGTRVSAETFRRVSCDGALVAVTTSATGEVLNVGRKTRVVPTAVRRALWSRDRGCRFPMCSNRRFAHAHHVQHWVNGGRTSFDNLVLLCGFHHRLLHEGGFRMSWEAGAEPLFFTARGTEIAAAPRPPSTPPSLPAPIDDPAVNQCGWDGEPVDYHAAVDAMCAASG